MYWNSTISANHTVCLKLYDGLKSILNLSPVFPTIPLKFSQMAIECPNLQRLNLIGHNECLRNLKGLRMISQCCSDMRGLILQVKNHGIYCLV